MKSVVTFAECLKKMKGSMIKARREYIRLNRWRGDEWYQAWKEGGLAEEVEAAAKNGEG